MKSKVTVAGHALHPMLIVFPLGLLATSVVWDVAALASGNPSWGMIAYWTIVAGVVGALLAAIPGFIDWLAIPRGTRARAVGQLHMILNLIVVALFVVSLVARVTAPGGYANADAGRMIWGWIGVGIALVSGWLGGELVETLGIGVREGANPDAPSSLGGRRGRPSAPASGHSVPVHRSL
jgi:uncharacterized membrane protein